MCLECLGDKIKQQEGVNEGMPVAVQYNEERPQVVYAEREDVR